MPPSDDLRCLQNAILEAIARGANLPEIGQLVCERVEAAAPGMLCSLFTVHPDGRLYPLAGPGLPDGYLQGLTPGLAIGPVACSCGTAAFRGEPVEVTDIASDPLWVECAPLALEHGLRACWSSPIAAQDGRVVGTFALYYRDARGPTPREREIVQTCLPLCAIAIERAGVRADVHRLAFYDTLTGLPNRAKFRSHAVAFLAELPVGRTAQLLHVDLDDFKSVNDTHGRRVGDLALPAVATRLIRSVGADAYVARLGGDEFAVLQSSPTGEADARLLAQKIIAELSDPFDIEEQKVSVGASVGIAQMAAGLAQFDELSKRADIALREAKNETGSGMCVFAPALESAAQSRRTLKLDLRNAVDNGDFTLHYQPIMVLQTNELASVEALLRWQHPRHGHQSPGVFIPIIEEMGLIGALGDWVLREACSAASLWPRPIQVVVNLSPLQFKKPGLVFDVVSALHQAGLPPSRLGLEVTESALLARDIATRMALHDLHDFGVRLSLDDFGTGYSSLQSLRSFPFDKIKIDMSFVRDIGMDADSTSIIRAVIGLARDLGMRTVAEGIETEVQLEWLADNDCTEGQGYFFSKPISGNDLMSLLEQPQRADQLIVPASSQTLLSL